MVYPKSFMKMSKTAILWSIILTTLGLLIAAAFVFAAAAPMPPEIAVNHTARQCARVMRGDECVICSLPEGWEILGREPEAQCPQGYVEVSLQLECKGVRELRCCLPGHSGGQGDCAGLVLEALLFFAPCLLLVSALVGLIYWLKRRTRKPQSG
jgi:hypothetical protein